ncbi:MAG: DinB family protein [Planctomycetota bacterium]
MSLADALLSDLRAEAALTRKVLEAVPENRFAWQPHARSMTLGQLASHIAETPTWTPAMLESHMDFAAMGDYRPFAAASKKDLLAAHDRNVAAACDAIAGRDDAFMKQDWTATKGDKVLMRLPRHAVLRQTILHHWIQHRGQLQVYLRLCDTPVPQTYGPTADFPEFG